MKTDSVLVEVLLATYNGERFLREQVDSILGQDYPNLRILARDDGSVDGTVHILQEYANRFPDRFQVLPSTDVTGSAKGNFLRLMGAATADRICFSDQDDVWLPNKLSRTIKVMDQLESDWGTDVPLLVFTDLEVVDDKLNQLHPSFWTYMSINPRYIDRLNKLLVQGVVTGCTAMVNRRLLDLSLPMPEEATMHDRWIALLASTMGKSAFVDAPTILYRQHGGNVLGTGTPQQPRNLLQRLWRQDAQNYVAEWRANQRQATALLQMHSQKMTAAQQRMIEAYLKCGSSPGGLTRAASFVRHGFYRAGTRPNLILFWNLLTGSA